MPDSPQLAKVLDHLRLYEHPLLAFSAREASGLIEVLIDLKNSSVPVHTYVFQIHPRDLDHPQFTWHLQRQLYDALHDYFIEMFTSTPQDGAISRNSAAAQPNPAPAAISTHHASPARQDQNKNKDGKNNKDDKDEISGDH